jgi:hypothetical protein
MDIYQEIAETANRLDEAQVGLIRTLVEADPVEIATLRRANDELAGALDDYRAALLDARRVGQRAKALS